MSRAVIVPFFKYASHTSKYKCLEKYFQAHMPLWIDEIDHLYIIDSDWGITIPESDKITIFRAGTGSHWGNLNKYIPQIKESQFMIIDDDTIFTRSGVVDGIFSKLDDHDIVSMTDNSGALGLDKKFKFFEANEDRDVRQRFTPYLFACRTEFFNSIGPYDFTPLTGAGWTDSMGLISQQLMEKDPRIFELPEDRSTLYFVDGEYKETPFLDNGNFKWSQICPKDYGYYHIRNFGTAVNFLEMDPASYQRLVQITPRQEAFRLLAWLNVVSGEEYEGDIIGVVRDYGVSAGQFLDYFRCFVLFHEGKEY